MDAVVVGLVQATRLSHNSHSRTLHNTLPAQPHHQALDHIDHTTLQGTLY